MNVIVINAGSSSLKYQLLNVETREVYAKGNCERIGIEGSFIGHEEMGSPKKRTVVELPNHAIAARHVLDILLDLDIPIDGIGHRVVQGGWSITDAVVVDDDTIDVVRQAAPLAPLHNYAEADVIDYCRHRLPELKNVMVCDTAFHASMPERAWRYAIPRDVADKLHSRKYGYHGTSPRYIWRATHEFTGGATHKLVSCHL
ncbi:MAG: acetate kinase, partial [Atopobiaceae bacterium]|nr:acetate kinase [Atopobiaceae bacterium]